MRTLKTTFIAVAALATATSLVGCATTGTGTITQAQLIAGIQQAAVLACAVEPTAASVAALIAASNAGAMAGVTIAGAIAGKICAAVASHPATVSAALVHPPVSINGVTVKFQPVSK
jgi:hypothetical protein